jgi:hypothetical protein
LIAQRWRADRALVLILLVIAFGGLTLHGHGCAHSWASATRSALVGQRAGQQLATTRRSCNPSPPART